MPHADWIAGRIEGQCLEPNGHSYHNAIAFLFAWNGSGDVPILRESGWFFTWKPLFNFQQPPAGQPSSIGPSDSRSRLRRIWWSSIWCSCSPRGTQSEFLLLTCLLLHHFCKKGNKYVTTYIDHNPRMSLFLRWPNRVAQRMVVFEAQCDKTSMTSWWYITYGIFINLMYIICNTMQFIIYNTYIYIYTLQYTLWLSWFHAVCHHISQAMGACMVCRCL